MKKRNLKSLKLNKKSISSINESVKGGAGSSNPSYGWACFSAHYCPSETDILCSYGCSITVPF